MNLEKKVKAMLSKLNLILCVQSHKDLALEHTLYSSSSISTESTADSLFTLNEVHPQQKENNRFIHKAFLVFHGAFIVLACILATSCQRFDEESEELVGTDDVTLSVSTRSADEAPIQYPVNMFALTIDGKYAGSQIIQSENEQISFNLPKGEYMLIALSGITDEYIVPEKPNAEDLITFANGQYATSPLMYGTADVTLTNKSTKATIVLSYTVAAIQVKLINIPNANAVNISISPLLPSMTFDGIFQGDGQKINLACQKDEEGNWTHDAVYVFPGLGDKTTFSITIEEEGETKTFGYTYNGYPEANHPFNIIGNYDETLTIDGLLESNGWEEPINVNFTFGNNVEDETMPDEETPADETPTEEIPTEIPQVGTIWNDCIVASVSNIKENSVDLLLLSLQEWESVQKKADEMIVGYTVNGIGNWRLPDYKEAKLLGNTFNKDKLKALNKIIEARNEEDEVPISEKKRYICKKNGSNYSFIFEYNPRVTDTGPNPLYLIRAVAKYHFTFL